MCGLMKKDNLVKINPIAKVMENFHFEILQDWLER